MIEKYFLIDTNVLVHVWDNSDLSKHNVAKNFLKNLLLKGKSFVLTSQNMAELYNVLRCKSEKKVSERDAREIIEDINTNKDIRKISYNHISVQNAIELTEKYSTHFWDALIATTMLENGITQIYTENIKDFSKIPDIVAINPFEN